MGKSASARRSTTLNLEVRLIFAALLFLGGGGLLILGANGLLESSASEANVDPRVRDRTKVYFGSPHNFRSPAVVEIKKVYPSIPAYRRIQDEGLNRADARYHLLMEKATKSFRRAVAKVARARGHDLVAESGALHPDPRGPYPDLTASVTATVSSP